MQKKLIVFFLGALFLLAAFQARAIVLNIPDGLDDQDLENLQKFICTNAKSKIDGKIEDLEDARTKQAGKANGLFGKLSNLRNEARNKGYDVSKLSEDLVLLQDINNTVSGRAQTAIEKMKDAKNQVCVDNDKARNLMGEARNNIEIAKNNIGDIKYEYRETIRPHILEIKDQRK